MTPQNNDFNSYIYILYYQSYIRHHSTATFDIISQISIIILHPTRLVFLIFRIIYCLTDVLEQPRAETPELNVMAIQTNIMQRSVSKERYWLMSTLLHSTEWPRSWLANLFHQEMNCNKYASFIEGECNKNINILTWTSLFCMIHCNNYNSHPRIRPNCNLM